MQLLVFTDNISQKGLQRRRGMKCANCGAEIRPRSKFCEYCGTQITSEMLEEQERVNKEGCPKCGSTNIEFRREHQGEIFGKTSRRILRATVGCCKDCGYTWIPEGGQAVKDKKIWLWVLGWIIMFPIPVTILLLRKTDMDKTKKYGLIAAAWILYFMIGLAGRGSSSQEEVRTVTEAPKQYQLYLDLKSETNLLFDTYDMEIHLDGKELGTIPNGGVFTKLVDVTEGDHKLAICKAGERGTAFSKTLNVLEDMTFQADITHGKSIELKNMATLEGVVGAALEMDDVTDMILSDALKKLSRTGFVNISAEPSGDIWDKNNWLVTTQNIKAGDVIDKNERIILDCIQLDEYFKHTYTGKRLDEVQKLSSDMGFELRYKNAADGSDLRDIIASETSERKQYWKIDSVKQYSGKTAELSLTYVGTPEESAAAESKARAEAESRAAEESKAKAEAESRAAEESKAKAEAEAESREALAAIMDKMVFPDPDSKLGKDIDTKGKTSWCYINVDNIRNQPVKKKWKSATVTDGVAEYLDHLEDLGFTVKITDDSSRSPYAGFTLYETNFKISKADFSWTMFLEIQDEKFVEYELDIYLPE